MPPVTVQHAICNSITKLVSGSKRQFLCPSLSPTPDPTSRHFRLVLPALILTPLTPENLPIDAQHFSNDPLSYPVLLLFTTSPDPSSVSGRVPTFLSPPLVGCTHASPCLMLHLSLHATCAFHARVCSCHHSCISCRAPVLLVRVRHFPYLRPTSVQRLERF